MKKGKISIMRIGLSIMAICLIGLFTSCNKDLPVAEPAGVKVVNPTATKTIGEELSTNSSYSIFYAALKKAGLMDKLNDETGAFTVFAPDNDAIAPVLQALGLPVDPAAIALIPLEKLVPLVEFSIIPGVSIASNNSILSKTAGGFPNTQFPSMLTIGDLSSSGVPLPFQMSIFPSIMNGFWVNDMPIKTKDLLFRNGVIHTPFVMVTPPTQTLRGAIYSNPNYSYFQAALDFVEDGFVPTPVPGGGVDSTADLKYLLNYPVINATVMVPNDAAFKSFLTNTITVLMIKMANMDPATAMSTAAGLAATPAVFNTLEGLLDTFQANTPDDEKINLKTVIQGLLAYNILTVKTGQVNGVGVFQPLLRMYPNNLSFSDAMTFPTLVNTSAATNQHPGIRLKVTVGSAGVTGMNVTGFSSLPDLTQGGAVSNNFTDAPGHVVPLPTGQLTHNCVNGVFYELDKMLMPLDLNDLL